MNGLLNLYKPSGISSAAAVSRVKRILDEKTVGHMGTLDPMAEGVLIVGVGKSARLFDYLSGRKKTYIAKFKFGYRTDTLDALGTVIETTNDIPSVDAALGAMLSLVGEIEQIPPVYSAKHINGRRAYAIARKGKNGEKGKKGDTVEKIELKPTKVTIYDAQLICQPRMDETVFSITCSSGTYIRSICRDVAKMCGSLATLTYLQRTRSGIFDVKDSLSFEALEVRKQNALIAPDAALDLPRYDVDDGSFTDLSQGKRIAFNENGEYRIYCKNVFFGIGIAVNGALKIKTYLKDE